MKFKQVLTEETLEQAVASHEDEIYSDDLFDVLDRALAVAKRQKRRGTEEYVNVLVVGEAGTGKTARIKAWAQARDVNLFSKKAGNIDMGDLGGALGADQDTKTAVKYATSEFDALDRPNSVLFLDEFNRASGDVRGTLLTLINNHEIEDARQPGNVRVLENMMFTIAAINPSDYSRFTDELDAAELDRFLEVDVVADKNVVLHFIRNFYKKEIPNESDEDKMEDAGKLGIAEKLLTDRRFQFDGKQERQENQGKKILSPRSFTRLLEYCDGTKDDFLFNWSRMCNPYKKSLVEDILNDYVDVQDKANAAVAGESDSPLFAQKQQTAADKFRAFQSSRPKA